MDIWVRSAKLQKPQIEFRAFPWPHGARQTIWARHAIQSSKADTIYIVGHSSGCWTANELDRGLKDTSKVVLVALDGFTPDQDQLKRPRTQTWGAMCDGKTSKNFAASAGPRQRIYQGINCASFYALHFVLVNAAARNGLVDSIDSGYYKCRANLVWLERRDQVSTMNAAAIKEWPVKW